MCAGCANLIPVCAIDSSCSSAIAQNIKMIALGSMPIVGGVSVWVQTKVSKKKKKEVIKEK